VIRSHAPMLKSHLSFRYDRLGPRQDYQDPNLRSWPPRQMWSQSHPWCMEMSTEDRQQPGRHWFGSL